MLKTISFPTFLLLGTVAFPGIAASQAASAQQAAAQPDAPVVHRAPYSKFKEVYVDQGCRLLPDPAHRVPGNKKPRLHSDPVICHLESVLSSNHREETLAGNELRRSDISITEQTYVLQNITTEPAIFVVEEFVPHGWVVDSYPPPAEIVGPTALFRVHAQPGEIVRLHVGLRHTRPLSTKIVRTSPLAPPEPNAN